MKQWFFRYKKRHIWLLAALLVIGLFHLLKGNRPLMNVFAVQVTGPLKMAVGTLCAKVPFSVAELLIAAAIGVLGVYLACTLRDLLCGEHRLSLLYRRAVGLCAAGLTVYAGFCVLWGVNYYIDGFQEKSGIYAQPVSVAELTAVTQRFADEASRLSYEVPRDDQGRIIEQRDEIYAAAPEIYRAAEQEFPFLAQRELPPKRAAFSKTMSAINFTGYFFPFTGESNLNDDSPVSLLPSTIAHEMAHQRGIASEQECNFIAILVCEKCGFPAYEYAGALMGYMHLSNALYQADPEAWERIARGLDIRVKIDLVENDEYWMTYRDKAVHQVSTKAYDGFLKGYGDENGVKSYGMVVDLLTVYYGSGNKAP